MMPLVPKDVAILSSLVSNVHGFELMGEIHYSVVAADTMVVTMTTGAV